MEEEARSSRAAEKQGEEGLAAVSLSLLGIAAQQLAELQS